MKKLLEEMEKNQELKAKIKELDENPKSTTKDYIQVAAENGLELTEADFQPAGSVGELADDELEAVAGGKDACTCVVGGGGQAYDEKTCVCVLGGGGEFTDGEARCICVAIGTGQHG